MTELVLLPTVGFHRSDGWKGEDFDVFDGERRVGRIYRTAATEIWFWGVRFQLTGRKSYGNAGTLDKAKAMFQAEYERLRQVSSRTCPYCGKPFVPKQKNSRYCSMSCRNRTYSRRRWRPEPPSTC
jgi:hypothetical protein